MGMSQSPMWEPKQVTETSVSSKHVPKITFPAGVWLRTEQPLSSRWLLGMPQSPLCEPKQVTETNVSSKPVPKVHFQLLGWVAGQPSESSHRNQNELLRNGSS